MKQFLLDCWKRKRIRRSVQIGSASIGLVVIGLAAVCLKVILVDAIPVIALRQAKAEERQRQDDFLKATQGSAQMEIPACTVDNSLFSVLSTGQQRALFHGYGGQSSYEPICKLRTGYSGVDDPSILCEWMNRVIRIKQRVPANKLDNGDNYYQVCGHQARCVEPGEIEAAGETCLSGDNSYSQFPPKGRYFWQSPPWSDMSEQAGPNASKTANIRLKIEECSDFHVGQQHCTATIWAFRQRESWGSYLVEEYVLRLRSFVVEVVVLLLLIAATIIATAWRVLIVSMRRGPNSHIPWIVRVPLESAALDSEPYYSLNSVLDEYQTDYAGRRVWRWLFLLRLPKELTCLIVRRIDLSVEWCLNVLATRTKRAWSATSRLLF